MLEQYKMKRQQKVSFSEAEAKKINAALDIIKGCTGTDVSPNKFIKTSTISRAKAINEEGGDE